MAIYIPANKRIDNDLERVFVEMVLRSADDVQGDYARKNRWAKMHQK